MKPLIKHWSNCGFCGKHFSFKRSNRYHPRRVPMFCSSNCKNKRDSARKTKVGLKQIRTLSHSSVGVKHKGYLKVKVAQNPSGSISINGIHPRFNVLLNYKEVA